MQVEQAFVNRAKLFHIQGAVVDAVDGVCLVVLIVDQVPQGLEQVSIGDAGRVDFKLLKQAAVQGGRAQHGGKLLIGEGDPKRLQGAPQVGIFRVGGGPIHQAAKSRHAVVPTIERQVANKPSVFGHQQKEESVDEAQQVAIKFVW